MKRIASALAASALAALALAAPAQAAFGLNGFDVTFTNADGTPATQAGSHPFELTTSFAVNTKTDPEHGVVPDGEVKSLRVEQITGLVGNPSATPRCSNVDFATGVGGQATACPNATAVGAAAVIVAGPNQKKYAPVFNLVPPPHVAAKLGFVVFNGVPVTIEVGVRDNDPYNISAVVLNTPQMVAFYGSVLRVWGNPANPAHDPYRGRCLETEGSGAPGTVYPELPSKGKCPVSTPEKPFLTMPRACTGPLATTYEALSWQGEVDAGASLSHDDLQPPNPLGMIGCSKLGFSPTIEAKPTTTQAESASGLDFSLEVEDEGLTSPAGLAASDIRKAVVTLPPGVTANPSSAEGLGVCTEAQLARETALSPPGAGCPDAAKLGTVSVQTPLLEDQTLQGGLYLAEPYENRFGSLLALYIVIKSEELGIVVKQAARVEPDPRTGQLVSTVEGIPQLPFSHFKLHFREGARSPLVTPPGCGTHTVEADLTPWAGGPPVTARSSFEISSGVGGSACPSGGMPPFGPGFEAGTINNQAGSFSPFHMRLTRRDGDQDLTKFSAQLPPGMVAKLAGTAQCPEAAIAAIEAKAGRAELASPSCPASSQIGRVLAGAGVGSILTYVPGKVYLAGPYNGAPLSALGVVPAVAGPFDVGTVVTRMALRIDPRSAKVWVDGAASDPIPHILAGIPLKVRDIRAYVDRPDFTLNPTNCNPFEVSASLWGGGTDAFSSADDSPLSRASRFQAANCANLGFKPRLALRLRGATKRGGHPALRGTYLPRAGDANLSQLVLRLPRSAFLDQAHIRTICTRVQFAAETCPPGAVYGYARAYTPLLEQPLQGPVYLRSSDNNLPDFVADLKGLVDVEAVARIDSAKGGIRATFEDVPDAPLTKVVVNMRGGKKGLIVNSTNLCKAKKRADVRLLGQNARRRRSRPAVKASCAKKKSAKGKRRGGRKARR